MQKLTLLAYSCLCIGLTHAQVYTDYLGAGHDIGISISSSPALEGLEAHQIIDADGLDSASMRIQTSRFLSQATLGANREDIEAVRAQGFAEWIDEQVQIEPTYLLPELEIALAHLSNLCYDGNGPEITCDELENGVAQTFQAAWWQALMTGPDILRQRVAFALSQIFVVSGVPFGNNLYGLTLADYYDILLEHALGNYEDLLMDVTLHPIMGVYLTHFNNPRTIPEANIRPDENYAREVMQLFSIGLFELNPDGTRKKDEQGNDIPTYDNDDIKEFAKVFTGLGNGAPDGTFGQTPSPGIVDFLRPMRMYEFWHEPGPKFLLNDFEIPAGQSGMEDIAAAINHLANHPNTGPFICYRLIQHLVKSNPTPEFVERISSVFADNGQGERGDLGAVVKAILLDPEARDCSWISDPENGKLREPIARYTHFLRAFRIRNQTDRYYNDPFWFLGLQQQIPLWAPSVFNFYLPDYQPNGLIADADLVAPVFQLHNTATSISYGNILNAWNFSDFYMDNGFIYEAIGEDIPPEEELQPFIDDLLSWESTEVLIDELDLVLCHGRLSETTRNAVQTALDQLDDTFGPEPTFRVSLAVYLIMLSPDYTVLR
ncbi:MAG: DUF1800 domain-containing protein [Bacteroidota bacterium]